MLSTATTMTAEAGATMLAVANHHTDEARVLLKPASAVLI